MRVEVGVEEGTRIEQADPEVDGKAQLEVEVEIGPSGFNVTYTQRLER
jgi:hypothetical protein